WEATQLKDGDKLEIVHFVGGGSGRTGLPLSSSE
ncbi:MAG: sulfur carrier protein ThiS, partial [Actinomycetota bacterium]